MKVLTELDLGKGLKLELVKELPDAMNLTLDSSFDPLYIREKIPTILQYLKLYGKDAVLVVGIPRSWNTAVKRFSRNNNLTYREVNDYTIEVTEWHQ